MLQVPNELLEVGNASGHLIGKTFDGHDLNTSFNVAEFVEDRHLGADVIDHEGVFAELHFDAEFLLHKIHVTKCAFGKRLSLVTGFVKFSRVFAGHFTIFPTKGFEFGFESAI